MFAFADPAELWLPLSPSPATMAGLATSYSSPASRWNANLNQVCLEAVLAWIQAEQAAYAVAWIDESQRPAFWEIVNGSGIIIGDRQLVLIPSEAIDAGELVVPQEWVDIPNWVADYYLAVQMQVEPGVEEPWLRVWGYVSHQDLKTIAHYDADDRTYCVDATQLAQDWSVFWVTLRFCAQAQTRAVVPPLPDLSSTQAESLLQRLATENFPRLSMPFDRWGALIQQSNWRQQLYQQRTQPQSRSVHLSQWLQQQVITGWQRLETLLATDGELALNLRSTTERSAEVSQAKLIQIADGTVALIIHLDRTEDDRVAILVQLHPTGGRTGVPASLTLNLVAETGELLQTVQAGPDDRYIQLRRFRCPVGTPFQIQIEMDTTQVIEQFIS